MKPGDPMPKGDQDPGTAVVNAATEGLKEERVARIADVIRDGFRPYEAELQESFARVDKLVRAAERLSEIERPPSTAGDILRAAVVLTHACLEDFLRTLAGRILPECDEEALKNIPLSGLSRGKFQFHLGQLAQHREKTVDLLIRESVANFLDRSTFNSTTEIAQLLEVLGLEVEQVKDCFPALDEMIRRRHQIVHRSDKQQASGRGRRPVESIEPSQVQRWLKATADFTTGIVSWIVATSIVNVLMAEQQGPES